MNFTNFNFPVNILKSGEEKDGRIPITIIPSIPDWDKVNDKLITKAFTKKCINDFLKTGYLDFDHVSILGKSALERSGAIIGEPQKFYIDEEKQVPVCEGFLFGDNPYVKNSIHPAIKVGSKVFGASLGGKILKKSKAFNKSTNQEGNIISEITLAHIAITPNQKAVCQGTSVSLRKSLDGKEEEGEINFDSYNSFAESFSNPEILQKAMEAGCQTDIVKLNGGQAIQEQSLEGDKKRKKKKKRKVNIKKIEKSLPFILSDIVSGKVDDYDDYLLNKSFTDDEIHVIKKLLVLNAVKIINLK